MSCTSRTPIVTSQVPAGGTFRAMSVLFWMEREAYSRHAEGEEKVP